jgi:hypothetical protein
MTEEQVQQPEDPTYAEAVDEDGNPLEAARDGQAADDDEPAGSDEQTDESVDEPTEDDVAEDDAQPEGEE